MFYINSYMTLVYFRVDCKPWDTNTYAVPWQLNYIRGVLIINFWLVMKMA